MGGSAQYITKSHREGRLSETNVFIVVYISVANSTLCVGPWGAVALCVPLNQWKSIVSLFILHESRGTTGKALCTICKKANFSIQTHKKKYIEIN